MIEFTNSLFKVCFFFSTSTEVPEFRENPFCRPSTDSTDNDPEGGNMHSAYISYSNFLQTP